MQAELNDLIGILEEQRDQQAALVTLSEKKTQAITAGSSEALHGIVEEEKATLASIKDVERRQDRCVQRLAEVLGQPAESVRMSLIIEKAGGPQRQALLRLREELTVLIEKQLRHNEINMKLLQMNLDYVQFLINSASNQRTGATYGQGGSIQKAAGGARRLLDRKV